MAFSTAKPKVASPKRDKGIREANESTLTASRRDRLLAIKKREEMKDVLVKKFSERVNSKGGLSDQKKADNTAAIDKEITDFMRTGAITENNLQRLEKKIHNKTNGSDAVSVSNYSVASSARSNRSQGSATAGAPPVKFDWKMLDEYAVLLHDQDASAHKKSVKSQQKRLYDELTSQVTVAKSKDDWKKTEDARYHEESLKELELWRLAEEEKMREIKSKNMLEKHMRDDQLLLEKRIRDEEAEIKQREEKAVVERIQQEIIAEQEKAIQKQIEQKEHMAKVFKENQENREKKQKELKEQADADIRTMKEYNKLLDEQEKERQQEKDRRVARQKHLMDKMKETVLKQQEAKGQEDEIRAAKQKEEADLRALEIAVNKQEKLEAMRHETRDYLLKQMQDKTNKRQQALELKKLQASVLVEDTKQYDGLESSKVAAKKLKNFEHQKELQAQILEKERKAKEVDMSLAEEQMNKDLLLHVHKVLEEHKSEVSGNQ